MATPYPNVSGDSEKDSYNFFHSQLRINIECAFGMLVQRWGFLRKKAPAKYTIAKIISMVSCLCSLHNFLIENNGRTNNQQSIPLHTSQDELTLALDGAIDVTPTVEGDGVRPGDLSGGGHHFDDDPNYAVRRRISQTYTTGLLGDDDEYLLPRESMFIHVTNSELQRPRRNKERNGRA